MSQELTAFLIGAGSIAGAGLLTWIGANLTRLWHVPKRIDRIEAILPLVLENQANVLDSQLYLMRCIQEKSCNGDLENFEEVIRGAKEKMRVFLAGSAVSRREKA